MACRGCSSSNQRKSGNYGCRRVLQNGYSASSSGMNYAYRSSCASNQCTGGCNTCGSGCACGNNCIMPRTDSSCANRCNCGNHCTNQCNGCMNNCTASCGCANNCIMPRSTSGGYASDAGSVSGYSPFYLGPCGPVRPVYCCTGNCNRPCGCCSNWNCSVCNPNCNQNCSNCNHNCQNCNHNCCCENGCSNCDAAVYGYFTQQGCLCIAAGEVIPFDGASSSNGITGSGGAFTLSESGAYMITLSVMIPANTTLTTDFVTLIDDGIAAGGTISINKTQVGEPLYAQTQTVVSVAAGSVIRVVTSENVNISACEQIASLTIVKVG